MSPATATSAVSWRMRRAGNSRPSPSAASANRWATSLLKASGGGLHLAGKLRADDWQGREDVQFLIDDGA